ncbi:dihydropteroate synthase [Corynebacterium sanguinis]|uniref:dihydropteroate synthase n=1 Tax=Corynebacterium sanguinis TaxID=2594913 RepID=UPI0021B0706B|nr:dihydropteroate synthase [Corynebacterium sanguinis]MCT1463070.1 dihydropteroate synthase [Corynebacterium sanguinis]MCT1585073.1 dihydropteroate synthase [Corynebacterium sanguinis]MCT1804229.1 dihydropteroate synthase [Corynebacterium sanguinis]MCT2158337.1 dihydropteroate synthase [Corynebacterium sanguinis]MCT2329554.1 dihydropteroate synthase [Corynebacterium sanguinis]
MTTVQELTVPGRALVMGIVNVTSDSFSDGGRWLDLDSALDHARTLVARGADIIDVGAESTRPGAVRVPAEVEAERVRPVIEHLHAEGIRTSVDTMRASTARIAAAAGVDMINDVSAGLADPDMYRVMADANVPVCLMHWRTDVFGDAAGASDHGGDVTGDVHALLNQCIDSALAAGVRHDQIVVDPGLGFAKTAHENWRLLATLPEFIAGPYPVLVGASRKRFLTAIRAERGLEHGPEDADPATAAVTAIAAQMGAWCVRVHEVAASRDAVDVAAAWNGARRG